MLGIWGMLVVDKKWGYPPRLNSLQFSVDRFDVLDQLNQMFSTVSCV